MKCKHCRFLYDDWVPPSSVERIFMLESRSFVLILCSRQKRKEKWSLMIFCKNMKIEFHVNWILRKNFFFCTYKHKRAKRLHLSEFINNTFVCRGRNNFKNNFALHSKSRRKKANGRAITIKIVERDRWRRIIRFGFVYFALNNSDSEEN